MAIIWYFCKFYMKIPLFIPIRQKQFLKIVNRYKFSQTGNTKE